MRTVSLITAFLLSTAFVPLSPGEAHHSFAMYDQTALKTLSGTVKDFQWTNPHAELFVIGSLKNDQSPSEWKIETFPPGALSRMGWSQHSLNPGDKVQIVMAPLKDGGQGGALIKVTLTATGQILTVNSKALERAGSQ